MRGRLEKGNWNMSEMPIVPGPKEARFPHLRHAGPTTTSGSHHHHYRHVCHEYFRWAATAYGDRLSRNQWSNSTSTTNTTTTTTTITNPLLNYHLLLLILLLLLLLLLTNHRPPLLARKNIRMSNWPCFNGEPTILIRHLLRFAGLSLHPYFPGGRYRDFLH